MESKSKSTIKKVVRITSYKKSGPSSTSRRGYEKKKSLRKNRYIRKKKENDEEMKKEEVSDKDKQTSMNKPARDGQNVNEQKTKEKTNDETLEQQIESHQATSNGQSVSRIKAVNWGSAKSKRDRLGWVRQSVKLNPKMVFTRKKEADNDPKFTPLNLD